MSTGVDVEDNKAVIRELWRLQNVRDHAAIEALVDPAFVNHVDGRTGFAPWKAIFDNVARSFPDLQWDVPTVLGDGDLVAAVAIGQGTHTGAPWRDIEPSGNAFMWDTMHVYRLRAGLITEHSAVRNDLTFYEQLRGRPAWT
jgi:predicted ester cyclase